MTSKAAWKCLAAACIAAAAPRALAQDNPLARGAWGAISAAPIQGVWNGTDLERRTACASAQNNGSRGTYAEFDLSTDPRAHTLAIDEKGITGLTCAYGGTYSGAGETLAWSGSYSCSDGKQGTFTSRSILVTPNALSIRLQVQLVATETCAIDKVIGAGRLYP